ncbi:hypothetical protein RRF57_008626 [Xylaria bambusicola]|uniref:Melanin-concentrating hormone n=1 Tax=Xylaria bambusicola TaxID=326684 RepID=A0AAN7Z771_9PEZI
MLTVRVSLFGIALFTFWTNLKAEPALVIIPGADEPGPIKIGQAAEFDLGRKDRLSNQDDEDQFFDSSKPAMGQSDTSLAKRTAGNTNNPILITVDVSRWQDIAEQNCYVIICHMSVYSNGQSS